MNLSLGVPVTLALLVGNGFFVATEFALVAARRPRLERAAARGGRAAAAAVAGIDELSLTLAGAQLGITMCSLGLGLVSEPVIADTLAPAIHAVGLPDGAAHAVAFVLALALVTFLHMVVGEMAPKSWAITDPERSATLLGLPFRAFATVVRPLLAVLNGTTNLLLRVVGVEPADTRERSRTPEQLRSIAQDSRRLGLIEDTELSLLTAALDAPRTPLAGLVVPVSRIVSVPAEATPQEVIDAAARTGSLRIMLRDGDREPRMVHVRDAYLARARGRATPARELAHPVPTVPVGTPVGEAVAVLRNRHSHLGLAMAPDGRVAGLVNLDDLLTTLLPVR
ncbi:CBS domain containing-hemolysin-like protein [Actinomadura pelletieri DSM 43383]|uniref:CBS domain containing-hemolysin-like protein n=1 Tax=Actinomadura pelletieri DSM 43383 TaxID=1120940 RepID=A0A495QN72_9ACTN|nr:CNNM domain-containing protein [Actinomadura pelletieri]RKS74369.1 CBS domain containing-hemolysin-like protein [Actinomadura pelletieri DSM 43383]